MGQSFGDTWSWPYICWWLRNMWKQPSLSLGTVTSDLSSYFKISLVAALFAPTDPATPLNTSTATAAAISIVATESCSNARIPDGGTYSRPHNSRYNATVAESVM